MTATQLKRINVAAFVTCLASIVCGILVGLLGIWGVIGSDQGLLWRALASCGAFFAGSIFASLALGCFRTNEE